MAQRKATIILTPDNPANAMDIQTGGLSDWEIVEALQSLSSFLAKRIINDAKGVVGDDPKTLEQYLDYIRDNGLHKKQQ